MRSFPNTPTPLLSAFLHETVLFRATSISMMAAAATSNGNSTSLGLDFDCGNCENKHEDEW